jgi:hypothetical protein
MGKQNARNRKGCGYAVLTFKTMVKVLSETFSNKDRKLRIKIHASQILHVKGTAY